VIDRASGLAAGFSRGGSFSRELPASASPGSPFVFPLTGGDRRSQV